jgi:hypothetical protein
VIGMGIGAGFGLSAISSNGRSNEHGHCDGGCDPEGAQARHDAIRSADTATVFFVAGGLLLAGGAVLYVVSAPSRTEASSARHATFGVTALAAPGTAGLRFVGDF